MKTILLTLVLAMGLSSGVAFAGDAHLYGHHQVGWSPGADSYQAPDGTYYSLSDAVRSINGTPCGIACEARHERELQNH
jgi:hypothetical protein